MLNIDRDVEFPQLAQRGVTYADWTGAAKAPWSLVMSHAAMLLDEDLGNPHSHHSSSARAQALVEEARAAVLAYFCADPKEYDVLWTQNASAAILLLQHYHLGEGELLLTTDNHNTMLGLREIARRGGATVQYVGLDQDMQLDEQVLRHRLNHPHAERHLFGLPAKSNYSGVEHPVELVSYAQERGWDVILDAAAYLANKRLDLSRVKPEFIPVSFYKLFGYPTGLGCLIVKKSVYPRMGKRWFAGGTIQLVNGRDGFHVLADPGPARFEDGTVNYQMIPAVTRGLEWLGQLGDREVHAKRIATGLYEGFKTLNQNGNWVKIHSPKGADIVTFSVMRDTAYVPAWEVEQAADAVGIQFRSGCFCNPGANEAALGYKPELLREAYDAHDTADGLTWHERLTQYMDGAPIGALRASFGYANTMADAARIVDWMEQYLATI